MALSSVTYSGNGSTTQFAVPFQYLFPTDVSATVNGVMTPFTFVNPGVAAFTAAPPASSIVIISRHTNILTPIVVFEDGSTVEASDINTAELQSLYLAQEANDLLGPVTVEATAALAAATAAEAAATAAAASAAACALISFGILPTTLPATAGILWNDGGVLSISA